MIASEIKQHLEEGATVSRPTWPEGTKVVKKEDGYEKTHPNGDKETYEFSEYDLNEHDWFVIPEAEAPSEDPGPSEPVGEDE